MVEEAYKIRPGSWAMIHLSRFRPPRKAEGYPYSGGSRDRVTATAIYTQMQAFLAAKSGAQYVAPYINRIDNLGSDGVRTAKEIHDMFRNYGFKTEVLAASFKNSRQVITLCEYGIGATTISPDVLDLLIKNDSVTAALNVVPQRLREGLRKRQDHVGLLITDSYKRISYDRFAFTF